jgi:hypothetical protein
MDIESMRNVSLSSSRLSPYLLAGRLGAASPRCLKQIDTRKGAVYVKPHLMGT